MIVDLTLTSLSSRLSSTCNEMSQDLKAICVFCASSPGSDPIFRETARSVGYTLAERGYTLVYGGGMRGLMGMTAEGTLSHPKGNVIGVLPRALSSKEIDRARGETGINSVEGQGDEIVGSEDSYEGRIDLQLVDDMHTRKQRMAQLSDGFVVLPGGFGTFEEMMEMVTWNQLGIHKKPIVVLNVKGFYTPIVTLMKQARDEGFIQPANLSLIKVIDLDEGSDWGKVAIDAIENWQWQEGAAYNLEWNGKPKSVDFELFSTARYTCTSPTVRKEDIPLFGRHVMRLRTAHAHFLQRDGEQVWGHWAGEEVLWEAVRTACSGEDKVGKDFRVRTVLPPGQPPRVELHPAPAGSGPFSLDPSSSTLPRRPLVLDPEAIDPRLVDTDLFMFKTTRREAYDAATKRSAAVIDLPKGVICEALLHTSTHITESSTSNIAIYAPDASDPTAPPWLTPRLTEDRVPGLQGVTRAELLERGVLRLGDITVNEFREAAVNGTRIIGFNGLRGIWEASVMKQR